MTAYSPTLRRNVDVRRQNYYFISPTPARIGDEALIVVDGESKRVRLCKVDGVRYCSTYLVELMPDWISYANE